MNTNTGEIRALMGLTDEERESGEWVSVSDAVAKAAIEAQLEEEVVMIRRLEAEAK